MIRKNFYLTKEQNRILKGNKALTISEHIRRAIDEYIARFQTGSSTSPSEKGGGQA